jgi:radical SAM protein with 4Fe4S-binding SPASM domain
MNVLSWPSVVVLQLTPYCNNLCPGCSNVFSGLRTGGNTSASQWVAWLEIFAPETAQLHLTGGEPTLHPEFFTILETATGYDAWVTIFTNGRWINPELMIRSVRNQSRLAGLLISLHGATVKNHEAFNHTPGSFEETIRNIRNAADAGISVSISTVITRYNWDTVTDIVGLGESLGASEFVFNRYLGAKNQDKVRFGIGVPQCLTINSSRGCNAGVTYASIDPWGNMRPCGFSPTIVGSLYQSTFNNLWHSPMLESWRNLMPEECMGCAAYSTCHGGCKAIQELRRDKRDPLRCNPLSEYSPPASIKHLPADVRPRAIVRMRSEEFGLAVLGMGQVVPVTVDAEPIIRACDGQKTFRQLYEQFGPNSLSLLGELWEKGMLEAV